MTLAKSINLEELFKCEKLEFPQQILAENDLVIVPTQWGADKQYFDCSIVSTLKELKVKIPKTEIYSTKEITYRDFRSADFEAPLFIIINDYVRPIVLSLISRWIANIISNYLKKKKENPENKRVKEPSVKVRYYREKKKKYFEIEGDATTVQEIVKELMSKS